MAFKLLQHDVLLTDLHVCKAQFEFPKQSENLLTFSLRLAAFTTINWVASVPHF